MSTVLYGGTSWVCPNDCGTAPCDYCAEKMKEAPLVKWSHPFPKPVKKDDAAFLPGISNSSDTV